MSALAVVGQLVLGLVLLGGGPASAQELILPSPTDPPIQLDPQAEEAFQSSLGVIATGDYRRGDDSCGWSTNEHPYAPTDPTLPMYWCHQQLSGLKPSQFRPPLVIPYQSGEALPTSCGQKLKVDPGAFYCVADETLAYSVDWLRAVYAVAGDAGPRTILAHEWGHHLEAIDPDNFMPYGRARDWPFARAELPLHLELQADCLAGEFLGPDIDTIGPAAVLAFASGDRVDATTADDAHGTGDQRRQALAVGAMDDYWMSCTPYTHWSWPPPVAIDAVTLLQPAPGMDIQRDKLTAHSAKGLPRGTAWTDTLSWMWGRCVPTDIRYQSACPAARAPDRKDAGRALRAAIYWKDFCRVRSVHGSTTVVARVDCRADGEGYDLPPATYRRMADGEALDAAFEHRVTAHGLPSLGEGGCWDHDPGVSVWALGKVACWTQGSGRHRTAHLMWTDETGLVFGEASWHGSLWALFAYWRALALTR